MTRPRAATRTGVLVILGLSAAGGVGAQDSSVFLGKFNFEAGLEFDALREQIHNEGVPDTTADNRRFLQLIGVRSEGFSVVDPRLFTGNLTATFGFYQQRDDTNGFTNSQHGTLTNYDFDSVIFGSKPYTGRVYANRTQTFNTLPFSGTTRVTVENAGATFRLREDSIVREWGLPYFSANGTVYQQHINETTTTIGAPFRLDDVLHGVSLDASNGFLTSDLDVHYDYLNLSNRVFPQNSFSTQAVAANYSLDFGPDLNRRWDSRFHYYQRSGSTPLTIYDTRQDLHVDHYDNLYTEYRYLFIRSDQPVASVVSNTNTTNSGTFIVRHELYNNLITKAELQDVLQEVPAGSVNFYAGQVNADYQRSLPFNGQVTAHALGRYQINDNRLTVPDISVIEESHVAPTPIGGGVGFTLAHSFVVTSSIVLVDTQGGGRQSTVSGVDYEIVTEGDRTRIIPLASSNVIRAGDSLVVSYSYAVPAQLKYRTTTWGLGGTLDFRWISLSYDHEQSDQTSLSGDIGAQLLQNWRRDDAGLELHGTWASLDARVGAGYLRYDSTFLSYVQRQLYQYVNWQPGFDIALGVIANEQRIDYSVPARQSETLSALATLDWYAPGGWWVTAFADTRRLQETNIPRQVISDAGVRGRIGYGKLELSLLLSAGKTSQGTSSSTNKRFEVKLVRQF